MNVERVAMWGGWMVGLAAAMAATLGGGQSGSSVAAWMATASTAGAVLAWLTARLARVIRDANASS